MTIYSQIPIGGLQNPGSNLNVKDVALDAAGAGNQSISGGSQAFVPPSGNPPVHKYTNSQKGSDFFDVSNTAKTSQEFDIKTGIESDSPEVILLTDFVPAYSDNGNLNNFGEALQLKQDSMFASAQISIDNMLNSKAFDKIKQQVESNRQDIKTFCDEIFNKSFFVLDKIERIRKKFDFRNSLDDSVIAAMGLSKVDPGYPKEFSEILYDFSNIPRDWNPTKVWVQSCLELKHLIKDGNVPSFLTDAVYPQLPQDGTKEFDSYKNRYSFFSPISSKIKRFGFSDQQITDFPDFSGLTLDAKNVGGYIDQVRVLFENGNLSSNLFNRPLKSDNESDDFSLTKVSYLLCKEMIFSKMIYELTVASNTLKNRYNFVPGNTSNTNIWDYIIGQAGSDITDINNSPPGNGNSLISLSQFRDGNSSILSFENFFINDNVGKYSSSDVLTPGSYYFLESSINVNSKNGFDVERLNKYVNRLKEANNTINMLKTTVTDAMQSTPPNSYQNEFLGTLDITNKDLWSESQKSALFNPIDLHRSILEKVFYGSDLALKKIWTNGSLSPNDSPSDISCLLISAAMEDVELKCLLFMFVLGRIYGNSTSQYFDVIAEIIENIFKNKLDDVTLNKEDAYNKQLEQAKQLSGGGINASGISVDIKKDDIKSFLLGSDVSKKKILCNIADFIKQLLEVDSYLGSFRLDAATNKPTSTWYSGVDRISIFSMIFNICCLIVHTANPERLTKQHYDSFIIEPVGNVADTLQQLASVLDSSDKTFYNYSQVYQSYINTFSVFLTTLQKEMEEFSNSLQSNSFQDLLKLINSNLDDPSLTRLLMTTDQIKLIQSKLLDVSDRAKEDYSSPIKNVVPYFTNYASNDDVNSFLPIEDIHTSSWDTLLRHYLNFTDFKEGHGFNKKIISVGLPQKLRKKIGYKNADDFTGIGSNDTFGFVRVQVWRRDNLRPFLQHRSQDFIFNMNVFPTRVFGQYAEASSSAYWSFSFEKQIPMIVLGSDEKTRVKNYQEFKNHKDFLVIDDLTKETIYKNHVDSFLLEEYLRFVGSVRFDEHIFSNYDELSKNAINQQYANFVKSYLNDLKLNASSVSFFNTNSFVVEDISEIKKDLLKPKKFDRVFHIVFDPDDFYIDLNNTPQDVVDKYLKKQYPDIQKLQDGSIKRRVTFPNEFTFDDYFVTVTAS